MIKDFLFFIILPLVSIGITDLGYHIRAKNRYDILYGIPCDSVKITNQKKFITGISMMIFIFR
jgi:hypothetical protein